MKSITKVTRKNALLLAGVTFLCVSLSALIFLFTDDRIQDQMRLQKEALIDQVLSPDRYDNDLIASCQAPTGRFAGITILDEICVAKKANQPEAYVFETHTQDGYNGLIRLLVALTPQGEVLGVRVMEHHETPGLGDKIELKYSSWIHTFKHKWLKPNDAQNLTRWAVKKDGGAFDQFTGATITPRAVVNQVKQASLALLARLASSPSHGEVVNEK